MAKDVAFYEKILTPPFTKAEREWIGQQIREFQEGRIPDDAKQIGQIGKACYEIRLRGGIAGKHNWRIYLAIRSHIVVLLYEDKRTVAISKHTVSTCQQRLSEYEGTKFEK